MAFVLNTRRTRFLIAATAVLVILLFTACSKLVYEHNNGKLSRGTYLFMKDIFYQGQFEEEETPAKRNQAILNDLADLEGMGALGNKKGLKTDPAYPEYMFRQERARHGKAAISYWQKKYKDKFNWQMLFAAENLKYDEKKFLKIFNDTVARGQKYEDTVVAEFEEKPITYRDLKKVMTVSDYEQFKGLTPAAMAAGMKETLKAWLEKKIHDRLVHDYFADEPELRRFDHNRVAVLFLKVRYGKAGKGIYPGAMDKIKLKPMEIYDHFHKMQNTFADVLWVKAAYTVVNEESLGEELLAKLNKGADFEKVVAKYAAAPKFIQTAKPVTIKGYDRSKGVDVDREKRDYYERLILDMASRDVTKPDPYLGKEGIVIVRIYEVSRALETVKLQDVSWKVENDLRTKMLNAVFEPDVKDAREALQFKYNDRLIRNLP
ncbi:MAG: hypothetical protein J0L53_01875 [Spirochaetes bacterium]|nr:hypothetical protein [Spirochaetota bacterium]MBX3720597.1 hypothetical protein [Turneriella sp.]